MIIEMFIIGFNRIVLIKFLVLVNVLDVVIL